MAEETLRVIIDSAELDVILGKLRQAEARVTALNNRVATIGEGGGGGTVKKKVSLISKNMADAARNTKILNEELSKARFLAREAGIVNLNEIPAFNRELRIIGNTLNIPFFREASSALFQGRRAIKGAQIGREEQAIKDAVEAAIARGVGREGAEKVGEALTKQLALTGLITKAAVVLLVSKMIIDAIEKFKKAEKARRVDFEDTIRSNLRITHRQFRELTQEQIGFASLLEQFEARSEEQGLEQTILDTIESWWDNLKRVIPDDPDIVYDSQWWTLRKADMLNVMKEDTREYTTVYSETRDP